VLHPEAATKCARDAIVQMVLKYLQEKDAPFANYMMSLRFLANAFRWEATRSVLIPFLKDISLAVREHFKSDKKDVRLACATLIFKYHWALRYLTF
jgi:hypothetical protein